MDEQGDGRPFWRYAVATATGCADDTYFEELYQVSLFLKTLDSEFFCIYILKFCFKLWIFIDS